MTDTPEIDDADIGYWRDFPYSSAPVEWIKWCNGPEDFRWSTRDHRAALGVIDAAQRLGQLQDADGAVAVLMKSGVPWCRLAQAGVYFLMTMIGSSHDPHGFAADMSAKAHMSPGSSFHGDALTTIAIAEAAAEFIAVAEADRECDPCGRMHDLLNDCPTPLTLATLAACRVLGSLWSEQPESFDGLRRMHTWGRDDD